MERQLHHYYDPNNENRVSAGLYSEAPEFAINHICNGEIDPVYDIENDCIVEHSSVDIQSIKEAEIEAMRQQTSLAISEYMREHKERFIFRQIEIPQYAWDKYDEMRFEYQIKKQAILNR